MAELFVYKGFENKVMIISWIFLKLRDGVNLFDAKKVESGSSLPRKNKR